MDENRIVFIRGDKSEWYDQAIFILKSANSVKNRNLVAEAEKIINNYMMTGRLSAVNGKQQIPHYAPKATAASEAPSPSTAAPQQQPKPVTTTRVIKRKYDDISVFISLFLIICSVMFGIVIHSMMMR